MALADSGCDELPQQIPGLSQSFFPGRTIRGAPTEVRERDDETAIGIALDFSRIVQRHCEPSSSPENDALCTDIVSVNR